MALIRIPLFQKYTTTASYVYGKFGPPFNFRKNVKTSGSSTTVSEFAAGDASLAEIAVAGGLLGSSGLNLGGELSVNIDGVWTTVYVTDATLAPTSVVVDTAVTWTGNSPQGRKFFNGTGADDGWIGVQNFEGKALQVTVSTLNSTSVDFNVEGRIKGPQQSNATITTQTLTSVGGLFIPLTETFEGIHDEIRVGVKQNGAGANVVSVYFLAHLNRK